MTTTKTDSLTGKPPAAPFSLIARLKTSAPVARLRHLYTASSPIWVFWHARRSSIESAAAARTSFDFEKHLREIQKLTHVGSWEYDAVPGTIQWSDEHVEIFGIDRIGFEPTVSGMLARVHPEDVGRVSNMFSDAKDHHLPFSCVYRVVRPDGSERLVSACGTWDFDDAGGARRMYGTAQDITHLKQTEHALSSANHRVRVLATRVLQAQEVERMRIARELHDVIGQALTAVQMALQRLKRLSASEELLKEVDHCTAIVSQGLEQVRTLSLDLRPPHLDDLGLEAALRWFVREHCEQPVQECTFTSEAVPGDLSPEVSITCFRVAQEAITNIIRHANATEVTVALTCTAVELVLCIRDNGKGFDVDAAQALTASIGLLGMQERVILAGGRLDLSSTPGAGTRVVARFPLRFSAPAEVA